MKLLLKTRDYCYYNHKGVVVWVKNPAPYIQRTLQENIRDLKARKEF